MCHGGCDCQGPWERVTFLAYDPVSTGRHVLVTEVGEGRGQFDGQHCLKRRNKMILRGRRLLWWRVLRPGLPFPQAQGAWEAAGLGARGLPSGPTSATDCYVTLSNSLPHLGSRGVCQRGLSGPFCLDGSRSSVKGGRVGTAFEETGSSLQAWEWGPGGFPSPCGAGTQDCLGLRWRRRLSQGSFPVRGHPASRVEGCLGIFLGGGLGN